MKYKWFAKDGHVFSEQTKLKQSNDFRLGNQFIHQEVIAYNVGQKTAEYIARLHNESLDCLCGKQSV